ncbi:MAG: hypothetical protein KJ970_06980 [Candidatus Eisenbacteria bacterium]|uniref:Uncharacterized protein n=1 Tax=Eiseniibacteriota bacterium TaxID=2212470 RepID=A0A948W6H5_UNCEI|nr:hypothetical protein [Candidatus Eisenbacteria bacterium]MBU1948445.1 hypothetical protein [Candidatus Eisenbacteria bacterium]MBU2690656.1 hypothetical protein [Candidatus Eisenbacteria bacterium]
MKRSQTNPGAHCGACASARRIRRFGARCAVDFGVAAIVMLAIGCLSVSALGNEVRVEVQFFVPQLQKLEIDQVVWALPSPTAADFMAGYLNVPAPFKLTLFSNTPWTLSIKTDRDDISVLREGPIPLQWSVDKRQYDFISNDWKTITSGESRVNGQAVELSYRMLLDWQNCAAGVYKPRLQFKLN